MLVNFYNLLIIIILKVASNIADKVKLKPDLIEIWQELEYLKCMITVIFLLLSPNIFPRYISLSSTKRSILTTNYVEIILYPQKVKPKN